MLLEIKSVLLTNFKNAYVGAPAGINGVVFAAKLDHFIGAHPHIIALAAGELG